MSENLMVESVGSADEAQDANKLFFAVSPLKLAVMSLCTLGLYEFYWFYMNWRIIQAREKTDISPMLRSFFFPYFFCYSLFCKIRVSAQENAIKDPLLAGPLAAGWIALSLIGGLPHYFGLLSFLSIAFLVPVQRVANKINAAVAPQHDTNSRFTNENFITIGIGFIFSVACIVLGAWA